MHFFHLQVKNHYTYFTYAYFRIFYCTIKAFSFISSYIAVFLFMFHKIPFLDLYAKYNSLNCFAFHLTVLCKPGLLQSPWLDIKIIATPTKFCRNAL